MRRAEVLRSDEDMDETPGGGADPEEQLSREERKAVLTELLALLDPNRRAVVISHELEGTPMNDVAAALRIPVNTAWNSLRLAREDLRAAWR